MLIQQLRQEINVTNWCAGEKTVTISYFRSTKTESKPIHLIITPLEYLKELNAVAQIDGVKEDQIMAIIDDQHYFYDEYRVMCPMSQWIALQLAIQHELEKEIEGELESGNIFESLSNIFKPKF